MNGQRVALRQRRDLGELIEASVSLYLQNFWPLFAIAAIVIPLGIASAAFQASVEDRIALTAIVLSLALLQTAANLLAVAALVAALVDIDAGRPADFSSAYDVAFGRFWSLAGGVLRAAAIVLLLVVTIIGIPWAIQRAIRWLFVEQAVILDGAGAQAALRVSADAVAGSWWRTLGISTVFGIIAGVPSAIVGALLRLAPVLVSGTASAVVNAALLPFAVTATTLLYLDLKARKESVAAGLWP